MRRRILRWAIAGICIAIGWTVYIFATAPDYKIASTAPEIPMSERVLWAIVIITCPGVFSGMTFHWVIPLNGVIYAIVGFAVALVQSRADR